MRIDMKSLGEAQVLDQIRDYLEETTKQAARSRFSARASMSGHDKNGPFPGGIYHTGPLSMSGGQDKQPEGGIHYAGRFTAIGEKPGSELLW